MMNYRALLALLAPETILVVTALLVLVADLGLLRRRDPRRRATVAAMLGGLGCFLAMAFLLQPPEPRNLLDGMLVVNPLTQLVKQYLLFITFGTLILAVESRCTCHVGEYFALLLLATVGFMFMVSSENLLMIFVSLELASLSLYILTAFARQTLASAEAALKYYLFGGLSAAFMLFGMSLLYGLTGEINLPDIADRTRSLGLDPLLILAMAMIVVGLGFKIAAVPFQLWAPDVYQGAPVPSAALIASGSKVASFFLLAKVAMVGFSGLEGSGGWGQFQAGWVPLLAALAAFSIILGNLAALAQQSLKRLLAYSAIAHAGYMLTGVVAGGEAGLVSLLYYVLTYALTAVGAFGVVAVVEAEAGDDRLSSFAGLSRRAPLMSFCLLVFLLSLAGIPPLAGFFGKFYMFSAAAGAGQHQLGLLWLVILAIAMSAVSLYYYLQVLKQVYVSAPAPAAAGRLVIPLPVQVVIACLALSVIILGCFPNLLAGKLLLMFQGGH
jgi:NADH-quinone oxidoreductase subunit N